MVHSPEPAIEVAHIAPARADINHTTACMHRHINAMRQRALYALLGADVSV